MMAAWRKLVSAALALAMLIGACGLPVLAQDMEMADFPASEAPAPEPESPTEPVQESADVTVTPGEADFNFSNGTIKGLTSTYMTSLSEAQKQNIFLRIPNSINGSTVTKIDSYAFYGNGSTYKGYRFVGLDLSEATGLAAIETFAFAYNPAMQGQLVFTEGLTSIGSNAFYNAAVTGDLTLPNSLVSLGSSAFDGCKALNGTLTLPDNPGFTTIPSQAFNYVPLTGTLTIPNTVTSIGSSAFKQASSSIKSFSGEVIIPDSVETLGASAFAYQSEISSVTLSAKIEILKGQHFKECKSLTTVVFPENSKLHTLDGEVFRGSGLSGFLTLPVSLKSINSAVFGETKLSGVSMLGVETVGDGRAFIGCAPDLILCDQKNFSGITLNDQQDKLCYTTSVNFDDGKGGVYEPLERLYNRPLNFVKQSDGTWVKDLSYCLPAPPEGPAGKLAGWVFQKSDLLRVTENSIIKGNTLYPAYVAPDPVITFGPNIEKLYDGTPTFLTVTATHDEAKPIGEAKPGDVVFYYIWSWATIGGPTVAQKGFDLNQYELGDVRSDDAISCKVTVQACRVNDQNKAIVFYTISNPFIVKLSRGIPAITPLWDAEHLLENGLPALTTVKGGTPGTIAWDESQSLKLGTHDYAWTFLPTHTGNYNSLEGVTALSGWTAELSSEAGGKIEPAHVPLTLSGKSQTVTLTAEPGYRLNALLLDDLDVSAQVQDGVYTLSSTGGAHTLRAQWTRTSTGGDYTPPPKTETETKTDGAVTTETTTTTTVNRDGSVTTDMSKTVTNAATGEQTRTQVSTNIDKATGTTTTATVTTAADGKTAAQVVVENAKGAQQVSVPAKAIQTAAQADSCAMTVHTALAQITLDAACVAAVADAIDTKAEKIVIAALPVTTAQLPAAARDALSDATIVDLFITVGSNRVSDFQGGKATVCLPYTRTNSARLVAISHVADDGRLARIHAPRYDATTKTVTFQTSHFSFYAVMEETPLPFTDVSDSDWCYDAVRFVTGQKLFSGTSVAQFSPITAMSREMLATVLYRSAGAANSDGMILHEFPDGSAVSAWAANAMRWAVQTGAITGTGGGYLAPQAPVSRQELAVVLHRSAGAPKPDDAQPLAFADSAQVAPWARDAALWAVQQGIMTGRPGGLLDPTGMATRAEVAAMLQRQLA